MVKFTFDFRRFTFEHGLQKLEQGYAAARDALLAEVQRIEAEARAYEESGEWIGEREDGHILWEQSQLYEAQIDDTHGALAEVRNAFVIALYHHWERSAVEWTKAEEKDRKGLNKQRKRDGADELDWHKYLEHKCSSISIEVSPDLDACRMVANHMKHGPNSNSDWKGRLREKYPDFLTPKMGFVFGVSEPDLYKIASTILASGPPEPKNDFPN